MQPAVRLFLHLLLISCLVVTEAFAQSSGSSPAAQWAQMRLLDPGTEVEVRASRKIKGMLVAITDDRFVVSVDGRDQSLLRSAIREVKVRKGSESYRKAVIGAGIGSAAGLATSVAVDRKLNDGNGNSSETTVLLGLFGGLVGFVIGSLKPTYRTVYKADL